MLHGMCEIKQHKKFLGIVWNINHNAHNNLPSHFLYLDTHIFNHYSFFTSASQMVQNKYI